MPTLITICYLLVLLVVFKVQAREPYLSQFCFPGCDVSMPGLAFGLDSRFDTLSVYDRSGRRLFSRVAREYFYRIYFLVLQSGGDITAGRFTACDLFCHVTWLAVSVKLSATGGGN